jgi:hypothetical protein
MVRVEEVVGEEKQRLHRPRRALAGAAVAHLGRAWRAERVGTAAAAHDSRAAGGGYF